nr:MAG TPA: hypothetical protein [Caudoviricetes sp.]
MCVFKLKILDINHKDLMTTTFVMTIKLPTR